MEKEISSVVAPPATTAVGVGSNEMGKEDDNLEKKNSETSTTPSTVQESPANKQVEMTDVPAVAIAPGPLGEAEVEAQKGCREALPGGSLKSSL